MNFEPENAVTLGAVEKLMDQHYVHKQAHSNNIYLNSYLLHIDGIIILLSIYTF